ncbi:MAG: hypothetical protein RMK57_15530 [Bryobacterales bacterium]|nr:hypothetical protein [Bryobacteraceae bacterium]MDW8355933.1 hypothetical protein [Bryobacterales bacterium]
MPLEAYRDEADRLRAAWFEYLMPSTTREDVARLLAARRYVIRQGPPGTGHAWRASCYSRNTPVSACRFSFIPAQPTKNFVGGLAPVHGHGDLGLRFAPTPGFLMRAATEAARDPSRNYLLHIDEINRADLAKILGEGAFALRARSGI